MARLIDLTRLQRFKAKIVALLANYFPKTGGTINGDTNVAGVLRVQGQQAFYYNASTKTQTIGTNNATGGTTVGCGADANMTLNGKNVMSPNVQPKASNTYTLGSTTYRWKGIYSNTAVSVASDRRLKRGIYHTGPEDAERLAAFVRGLKVCVYNYKDDPEEMDPRIGLIAQEVRDACPELAYLFVHKDGDGMLSIRPADLVFPLIAAVQQLSARVDELSKTE